MGVQATDLTTDRTAAGRPALVEFKGVSKAYQDQLAVRNQSLTIYENEFFALLGPSGCGKSTMLRLLAGLEEPTSGEILLAGNNMNGVPPHKRPVNIMFQSYALFPHMNVERNIAYGLRRAGMSRSEITDRVDDLLRLTRLDGLAKRRPDRLSGGQRQRVALARALARRPRVLLLDEPLAALDRRLRESTRSELADLRREFGMTFIMVTHDQEEAMSVADRVAVMSQGAIEQVGSPRQVYETPVNLRVAEFVGDINLINCQVANLLEGGAELNFGRGDETFRALSEPGRFVTGQSVIFTIRPERLSIGAAPPASGMIGMKGQVQAIDFFGDKTRIRVRLDSGDVLTATRLNGAAENARIRTGDDVWATWHPDSGVTLIR